MGINEPSLMDVAHDTINFSQGPALIEVTDSTSNERSKLSSTSERGSFASKLP